MLPAANRMTSVALFLTLSIVCVCVSAADLTEDRVRAYYAAWSSGEVDELMTYFAPDVVYEDVATGELAKGPDEVRAFASKFLAGSPGVKVQPTSILLGERAAAVEWTMGAGSGADAWTVRGVTVLQHRDGQIARATDYWDSK